jgi:hypothetical protein
MAAVIVLVLAVVMAAQGLCFHPLTILVAVVVQVGIVETVVRQITQPTAIPVLAVAVAVAVRRLRVGFPIIFLAAVAVAVASGFTAKVQTAVVAHSLVGRRP